jgi:hypothetical protein
MNEAKIQTKEHKTWEALCNIWTSSGSLS